LALEGAVGSQVELYKVEKGGGGRSVEGRENVRDVEEGKGDEGALG
tara:strand:- start:654 stop:791 length:138 start_codon:yes stop_codon:yes gene_type:complete